MLNTVTFILQLSKMMKTRTFFSSFLILISIALIYFFAAKLGLSLAFVHRSASAVWAPTGIALAALVLFGYQVWPAILAGAFLVNAVTEGSLATSLGIAVGNTLEGLAGAWLVNRYAEGRRAFYHARTIFRFLLLAGILSTMISPTIGVTSLTLGGYAQWENFFSIWFTWWLGDMGGNLMVAPLLLLWSLNSQLRWSAKHFRDLILVFFLLLPGLVLFSGFFPPLNHYPIAYIVIPAFLLAAFRLGPRDAASVIFIFAVVAVWGTIHSFGPFGKFAADQSLLLLQGFLAVISTTTLVIAGVVWERNESTKSLAWVNLELEHRIDQKTADLSTAEGALREMENRARLIVDTASDAFVEMNNEGMVTGWNRQAERMFGWTREEVLGKRLADLIIPLQLRERHTQGLARYLKTGENKVLNKRIEISALHKNGREFPVELAVWQIQSGKHSSFNAFIHDISARKQAEEERKRADEALKQAYHQLGVRVEERTKELREANEKLQQLDQLKSDFILMASHELRTPLTSIKGYIALILGNKTGPISEAQREFLTHVKNATDRLQRLLNDLLSISKIEAGQTSMGIEETRIWDLLKEEVAIFSAEARQKEIELEFAVGNDLKTAACDPDKIREVIANLISNALKYTPRQGRIQVFAKREADHILIRIKDTGIGIKEEDQRKIFQPFHRVRKTGLEGEESTGLGLALALKIMQAHHGDLKLTSKEGAGSEFSIILPVHRTPKA